jgi:hypothetical protein
MADWLSVRSVATEKRTMILRGVPAMNDYLTLYYISNDFEPNDVHLEDTID